MGNIAKFDITTPEGRKSTFEWFDKHGWMIQPYWLYWKLGKFVANTVKSLTSDAVEKEIEEQRKTAIEIIRAGKENGVDELEIAISEKAGLSIGGNIEGFPVELVAGSSGNMKLKVKYKD